MRDPIETRAKAVPKPCVGDILHKIGGERIHASTEEDAIRQVEQLSSSTPVQVELVRTKQFDRKFKSVKALEFPLVWRLEAAPKARKKATKRANVEGADEDQDNIVPISVKVVHSEGHREKVVHSLSEGPRVKPAGNKRARIVTEEQTEEHEGVLTSE